MAYNPIAFDPIGYDVAQSALHVYTSDNSYWIPLKCVVEVYDNTGNTLLLSYDMFDPEANTVKLLECTVSLGLTNTQFTLRFEDGLGVIDQNTIGLGNKVLVYAGRSSDNLTLLFTGYSENRSPVIIADKVMDYEMSGYGENATLNDLIVNFKRASSQLTEIDDPNFPKRPDSKMVVHELVRDLFEDPDVRVTKDIILKDYLNLDTSGISPLVTERLLSVVQSMTEVSQVLNFLQEVTGAYWNIENGKLLFEYPEVKHSGIIIKNKVSSTDLADSTSYFTDQWRYTDSISKENGFANRIYTTTATDTKSVANSMTNKGATALFDRAIAVQVTLLETRVNTIALIMSKIGDPFTPLTDEEEIFRGGPPQNPPPPPVTCPQGYHRDPVTNQCVPDVGTPGICPAGYLFDTATQRCVPEDPTNVPPTICPSGYQWDTNLQVCVPVTGPPPSTAIYKFVSWGDNDTTPDARTVLDRIMTEPDVSAYLFAGDGPYSTDSTEWIQMMSEYFVEGAKKNILYLAQGNHEHPESESQNAEDQIEAWMPGLHNSNEGLEWLVSRKVGNVFVIVLNSQDPNIDQVGGTQYNWVQDRLDEAVAMRTAGQIDWIVTMVHKSWFNLLGSNPAYVTARHAYAAMFREAQVDFMFNGHNHSYCIWKPIVDIPGNDENTAGEAVFSLTPDGKYDFSKDHGTFHIINGNGGHEINPWGEDPADFPNVIYANDTDFGYSTLEIQGKQAVLKAKLDNGTVVATVNVTRGTDVIPPPITCPTGYHWDTTLQQCVLTNPPTGGEGEIDSYGIKWLVARGQQFVVTQSRDESNDDRWSGNITGLRQGAELTFIGKSTGTNSSSHFASKLGGGNHSGSGASSQRWWDLGVRVGGEVQLQWEGPHPNNHDFTLPDTNWFIKNLGFGMEGRWIGLKWILRNIVFNGSVSNGGVRVQLFIDRNPINTTTNRPNNNWELAVDFIDGVDAQVISPQSYAMPDEWDCEVRRSDTNSHDVYGTGTIITGSGQGDPGLHVRRLGTAGAQGFADLPDNLKADFMRRKKLAPVVTDKNKNVGKPCKAFDCPKTTRRATSIRPIEDRENIVQVHEESGYSVDNKIVQSASQLQEQVVHGEIRIDNENKPTGPVISQFKVEVGGLSSTADTIFVNDIKVDASVLSPNAKYWLVLLPCGTSYRNTVLWHHDGDMTTLDKYSAFAKGATRNDLSDWHVSRYGPTYCHAIFARLRRIQEYSDPQSIQKFRLKEDIAEADFLDDSLSVAKMMQNVLAIRGKPVRKYDLNEVTLPAGKWFTPGQNVTIVDDTGHHEEDKNIFAENQEVSYSWSTSQADSTLGTFRVKILPVGHLNWHKELFPSGD